MIDKEVASQKRESTAYLIKKSGSRFFLRSTYEVICGQSKGRKIKEGDRKTPEGKYSITQKIYTGRSRRFGPLFLEINYPNYYDRKKNRSGSGNGIHGGSRFRYTLGCVRLRNSKLWNLKDYIDLKGMVLIVPKTKRRFFPSIRRYRLSKFSRKSSHVLSGLVDHDVSNDDCIRKVAGTDRR